MNAEGDSSGNSAAAEQGCDASSSEPGPQPGSPGGGEPEPGVTIDVAAPGVEGHDADWIRDRLESVVSLVETEIDRRIVRCSVRLVADPVMSEAHQRFSGVEGTTDVLTFVSESEAGIEIDLLACVDEASRRCSEFDHDLRRELLLPGLTQPNLRVRQCRLPAAIVHWYELGQYAGTQPPPKHADHEPEAHALMHAEEDRLLTKIGVGPVFRSQPGEEGAP